MKFSTETIEQITNILVSEFEKQMSEIGEDIEKMEYELRCGLQEVGQKALGGILSAQDEKMHQTIEKCECGGKLSRTERRSAKILSVFGWMKYRRGYYKCSHCKKWRYLLDEKQGLRPGQASRGMAKLMVLAGISVSFAEASKQLNEYLLVAVSATTIRKETIEAGERQAEIEEDMKKNSQGTELQKRERELETQKVPDRLYGSMDGAHAPLIKKWREMKTLCWYGAENRGRGKGLHAIGMNYHSEISQA